MPGSTRLWPGFWACLTGFKVIEALMNAATAQPNDDANLSAHSAAKRDAIVLAAAQVFLTSGYGNASMDQIAAAAGVSKQTVYSHFGAKDALFEAIVKAKCAALMGEGAGFAVPGGSLEAVLCETAAKFLAIIMNDESIGLYRIILSEAERFPELAAAFYRSGPNAAASRLAVFLSDAAARGDIALDDPRRAADLFFAMLRDDLYLERLLSLRAAPDPDEIAARAATVARHFMRAYQ